MSNSAKEQLDKWSTGLLSKFFDSFFYETGNTRLWSFLSWLQLWGIFHFKSFFKIVGFCAFFVAHFFFQIVGVRFSGLPAVVTKN